MSRATRNRRSSSNSPANPNPDAELELAELDEPGPFDPGADVVELAEGDEPAPFDPPAPDDVNPLEGEEPASDEFGRPLP